MFKLNANLDPDSLLYSLSHFECDGHTVHMLTQQQLKASEIEANEIIMEVKELH